MQDFRFEPTKQAVYDLGLPQWSRFKQVAGGIAGNGSEDAVANCGNRNGQTKFAEGVCDAHQRNS